MDFSLSEEQEATRDLARQILSDRETHEHLKEIEAGGEGFDRDTWAELAKAGLLGIPLPADAGRSGLGFVALRRLVGGDGPTPAAVPALATVWTACGLPGATCLVVPFRARRPSRGPWSVPPPPCARSRPACASRR